MTSPTDGKVSGLNADVFRTMSYIRTNNPNGPMQAKDAEMLQKSILKDGKVDESEADLLNELNNNSTNAITISAQKTAYFNPKDLNFSLKVSDSAKAILSNVKPGDKPAPVTLDSLWSGGPAGFKKMLDFYRSSPKEADQVREFLSAKVDQAWQKSSWSNGYGPLRAVIMEGYNNLSKLEGADNDLGRNIFYESLKKTGAPDMLYSWIRPGGYI
ncbi:MAG: hypothetical protein AB7I41_17495 [Candidatus Sericytochromatia bacterium]